MARLKVTVPGDSYEIVIENGCLKHSTDLLPILKTQRSVVVTNTTLAAIYGEALGAALPGVPVLTVPDGEQHKTLATVEKLYAGFLKAGLDRSGTVLAFGGGVVGDTAGFAAATYMRGVRFVQIPTSLLAMVDASVGGKVGVDLPQGKNLVGVFKQPEAVLIDPTLLGTLPPGEWRCGMAEVLKHGLLADAALLDPHLWQPTQAETLITRAVQVKVNVVQQDPYEQNIRAHLNLGHTFAHAFEQVSAYTIPHGEAVAIGLVAAARLSAAVGLCDRQLPEYVEQLVQHAGLPTRLNGLTPQAVLDAMSTDKKWQSGRSRFVLLRAAGQPTIMENVPSNLVLDVLSSLNP